jgi:hypothetical protein
MLDIGYDLVQEKTRLGRWPTVREAIFFLIGRDDEAADKLRALGPECMRHSIYVRGFGKIRNVEPDPTYAELVMGPGAELDQAPLRCVRVDAN